MTGLTTLFLAVALAVPTSAAAIPTSDRDETLQSLPASAWPESITALSPDLTTLDPGITVLDAGVHELDQHTTDGSDTVLSLSSDILFNFDKSDLSAAAASRIRDLVADVPQGELVRVDGHTDSLGSDDRNAELSLERARTVADVIAAARPDLELKVKGYGPTRPVEPNETDGKDNPQGRAENRRVEVRFAS